jgi:TPP-dependent pyruvate/acetoin dehydrogenase alpha subunit
MKRYSAYDPPEYVHWRLEPRLLDDYVRRIEADPHLSEIVASLPRERLLDLYRDLLRTRLHDIGLKRWVKQGVLSKAWLGTGEEAATVGPAHALDRDRDVVMPMIRNAGACFIMGMPMADLFRAYLATDDSPSGGRDLHVGDPTTGVIQPISHMGTNVPVMAGVALAFRNRGDDRVALTWIGDGATRTAECHEGANFAAVQNLPVVFVVQNNQVALGTETGRHSLGSMEDWASMYGIPVRICDGNNVLDTYASARLAVHRCRSGHGPQAIVVNTFRMGGHATHDEREARETFPSQLFEQWGQRDPIGLFEAYLEWAGVSSAECQEIERTATDEVETAADEALGSKDRQPEPEHALYQGFSRGSVLDAIRRRPITAPGAR